MDGNTIEFIYREQAESSQAKSLPTPTEHNVHRSQQSVQRNGTKDDIQSLATFASKAHSRAQTALDIASSTARSLSKVGGSTPSISRSKTEPLVSATQNGNKAIVGTLLGAAAGAAFAFAMTQSERDGAREEAAFTSSMQSDKGRARPLTERPSTSKQSGRRDDGTSKSRGSRYATRTLEAPTCDDYEVQEIISRHKSSTRPVPQRSRTYDAIEYVTKSSNNSDEGRSSVKRASTLPLGIDHYYIEAPKSKMSSRRDSRRGSLDDKDLKRHDSGISMGSHRSRRSSSDKQSTIQLARRNSWGKSAANVALPASKSASYVTSSRHSARESNTRTQPRPAQIPLSGSRAASYISAAQVPIPESNARFGYGDAGEESDGLSDLQSVVPDDSISCVDFGEPKRNGKSKSKSGSKISSSKRSQADSDRTIRPVKHGGSRHSAKTLPTRRKDDSFSSRRGKRSTATYA